MEVVGELHDNVWAHGKATGFSMAQKYKVPREDDTYVEFALADLGLGFMGEMHRSKKECSSHQEAIEWCIQEGNSTKLHDDPWTQRIPEDCLRSPFGSSVPVRDSENNHQGLGLAKLVRLVNAYSGSLQIASGDALFTIDENKDTIYKRLPIQWKGVAISCRLRASALSKGSEESQDSPELSYIIKRLEDDNHG